MENHGVQVETFCEVEADTARKHAVRGEIHRDQNVSVSALELEGLLLGDIALAALRHLQGKGEVMLVDSHADTGRDAGAGNRHVLKLHVNSMAFKNMLQCVGPFAGMDSEGYEFVISHNIKKITSYK